MYQSFEDGPLIQFVPGLMRSAISVPILEASAWPLFVNGVRSERVPRVITVAVEIRSLFSTQRNCHRDTRQIVFGDPGINDAIDNLPDLVLSGLRRRIDGYRR
jgi:hypothetical protein